MNSVIFLDFDGPLYPNRIYLMEENKGISQPQVCIDLKLYPHIHYWKMDHMAVGMINNMADNGSIFVISSSWAEINDLESLSGLLKINGFHGKIHKDWTLEHNPTITRSERIKKWLDAHPEFQNNYIVLDDVVSAPEMAKQDLMLLYGLDPSRIFLVDNDNGILMNQYHKIMNKLYS